MRSRRAIANSRTRRGSNSAFAFPAAAACLAVLAAAAVWLVHAAGCTLYYGDADAHLMIARRIVDSQTPGYDQLGTVWLPMLHLLMLPLVRNPGLWQNGLAGAIPVAACFFLAGCFLFAGVRRLFASVPAAAAALAVFALNPNLLYLASIPMTEAVFFAALAALLYFSIRFRETQGWPSIVAAGLASCAASLTRYDGWFLLPVTALYFLCSARRHRFAMTSVFKLIAALGPFYWLAHNWYMTGDWLDFYRGPYSALAIQGRAAYPGMHNWPVAAQYCAAAAELFAGPFLTALGLAGIAACCLRRAFWPALLLSVPPLVYIASVHSGGVPIFLPNLWPHSYYNTRYGAAAMPLFALGAAALVTLAPKKAQAAVALAVVLIGAGWWAIRHSPRDWAVFEESRVNSEGRRAWTLQAAQYLKTNYIPGTGILTSSYPLTGVLREAGIPLREALCVDNGLLYDALVERPELYPTKQFVLAQGGDSAQTAVDRIGRFGVTYVLVRRIAVRDQPVIEIYRR